MEGVIMDEDSRTVKVFQAVQAVTQHLVRGLGIGGLSIGLFVWAFLLSETIRGRNRKSSCYSRTFHHCLSWTWSLSNLTG